MATIQAGQAPEQLIFDADVAPTITQAVLTVLPYLPPPRVLALRSSVAGGDFDCSTFCACSVASPLQLSSAVERRTACPMRARWRLMDVDGNQTRRCANRTAAADTTAWEPPVEAEPFSAPTQYFLPQRQLGLRRTPLWEAERMAPPVRRLLAGLEANIGTIRAEYLAMLAQQPPLLPHGLSQDHSQDHSQRSKWSRGSIGSASLGDRRYIDGWIVHDALPDPSLPPTTLSRLLDEAGDEVARCPVCSAFFSRVVGDSAIQPHRGPVNHRLRVQLALDSETPPIEMCGMRVGSRRVRWVGGAALIFDDSYEHEVWCRLPPNRSRNLLIFDVWHPQLTYAQRLAVGASCHPALMKRPLTLAARRSLRPLAFVSADGLEGEKGEGMEEEATVGSPTCAPANASAPAPMLRGGLDRVGSVDVAPPFESGQLSVALELRGVMSNFHGAAKGSPIVVEGGGPGGTPLILCASDFGVLWALTFR